MLGEESQEGGPNGGVPEAAVLEEDGFFAGGGRRRRLSGEEFEGTERSGNIVAGDVRWKIYRVGHSLGWAAWAEEESVAV